MAIDRTRALFLVGFLAASGCVITTDDDDDDSNGEAGAPGEGGSVATGGRPGTGGEAGGEVISDPAGGGGSGGDDSGTSGTSGSAGEAGAPTASGGTSTGGASTGGTSPTEAGAGGSLGGEGGYPSGEGGADSGPLCDDSEGDLGGCDAISPDPSCEGIGDFQIGKCESAAVNFKPRIAEVIQSCIKLQEPLELCDATLTYTCADEAIQSSCIDDEAAFESCLEILTMCSDEGDTVDESACLIYLSALTPAGKAEMTTCMADWCDLYTCAEGL